ncbi:MAG: DUF4012 domain-containing protein [Patescibacteria group bacterium]
MKKYSTKFWISFIAVSLVLLTAWFVFWEVRTHGINSLKALFGILPAKEEKKTDLDTVVTIADSLLHTDGKTNTYLILFQNNLELRPGGGFIGSFGILKIRDGSVEHFSVHDTGNFDGRIPDTVQPPYPMQETLRVASWKLRDSNFAPDFPENALKAEEFYHMGNGEEQFDGVIGITTDVLSSFLKVTGPITLPGYPGTYGEENAILDLEYQVEQGYVDQEIEFGERKSVMGILGGEILGRLRELPLSQKYQLFNIMLEDLHQKDIQLYFKDEALQEQITAAGWTGMFDGTWKDDFLFPVDANLNSFKSDYYVKRSYDYTVDLSQDTPTAVLRVTYKHTAPKADWFTKDYQTFLRVYVPKGSFLTKATETAKDSVFGEYQGKKYFGALIHVPLGTEKTVTFEYTLPKEIERDWYDLKIQKQAGLKEIPVKITIIKKDGSKEEKSFIMNRDTVMSEL